jgi:predicted AAA+ superfamily ATPase
MPVPVSPEAVSVMQDLNPWWKTGKLRTPAPKYKRRGVDSILRRLTRSAGLIEVIRGPRQVGKTTAIEQAIHHLLVNGIATKDELLFIRFDQEVLRESRGGLRPLLQWYVRNVRKRPFEQGKPSYIFLDEIHKLDDWDSEIKDFGDTFPVRIVLTGSSSVLVTKGGRESLAGRVYLSEMPTFQFREIVEGWYRIAEKLPPAHLFDSVFADDLEGKFSPIRDLRPQQKHSLRRYLERYYNRGGYPKLYNGEVDDDIWADYLTQTIFDRVLGVDVPDLFPVRNPRLLRWIYVEVARSTGQEIKQTRLAEDANAQGFSTTQPHVGNYLHYLADALLIREFRRYPMAKRTGARTPAKITLTDLGARNAVFRGAPSLWESSPDHVGPLIETLAQSVLHGRNLQVHFFRDYEVQGSRKSPLMEVDFVVENPAGDLVPIEIKFRANIENRHFDGLRHFMTRFKTKTKHGIMVTRDTFQWRSDLRIMCVPLMEFLLAF